MCDFCVSGKIETYEQLVSGSAEKKEVFKLFDRHIIHFDNVDLCVIDDIKNPTIRDVITKLYPEGWKDIFNDNLYELKTICDYISSEAKETQIFPHFEDVFKVFDMCSPEDIKVIIIGQDPYPRLGKLGLPLGTGLSFSVRVGENIPRSLSNIYNELDRSIDSFVKPKHGNLENWVNQGVFLLNKSLTVENGKVNSHKRVWNNFTSNIIKYLSAFDEDIIYVLWGKDAQEMNKTYTKGVIF
ncbi:MAG: uracil-DNA glycosylase, partial [Rickettsiales bacterium]